MVHGGLPGAAGDDERKRKEASGAAAALSNVPVDRLGSLGNRWSGNQPRSRAFTSRQRAWRVEDIVDRIKILDEALWRDVPKDVIREAEQAATSQTCWIVRQGNGHIVAMDGPGDPEIATGDITFIAEVGPSES